MSSHEEVARKLVDISKSKPWDLAVQQDFILVSGMWKAEGLACKKQALEVGREFRKAMSEGMERLDKGDRDKVRLVMEGYTRSLKEDAKDDFDSFLLYMEKDRSPDKRFYVPRRGYLREIVRGYQQLTDEEIRFLSVSLPKRAGKSQLGINYTLFLSGRCPNKATLMEGAGDSLVKSFYKGLLEYLADGSEYTFYEIFPDAKMVETNADIKTINLHSKSRFPTIMCRSIDATQVGLSEATNVLYLDDCVTGREEAKNRERLDAKWEVISGDIMGRAVEGTPLVATGTRYSMYDPIGRIQEVAMDQGWKYRTFEIPALSRETGESNYEYVREGKKVFSTAYFQEQEKMLTAEQFESEFQQEPFEAKGMLFPKDSLNYYFELPIDKQPDAIMAVCDTAESGSDSVCLPVAYLYGNEAYIDDVVFNSGTPEFTKPQCANMLIKHNVSSAMFESNNAGEYFARDVGNIITDRGYRISIRTKRTISNKHTRIEFASDGIVKYFYFKHPSTVVRGGEYYQFMNELTTYTRTGKVPHDDAPDALSLLENELRRLVHSTVKVMPRPF